MKLRSSRANRGGLTSRYWYGGTNHIHSEVDNNALRFEFILPSKGGGYTNIHLKVALSDLRNVLKSVVAKHPKFAVTLGEIALAQLAKQLARRK